MKAEKDESNVGVPATKRLLQGIPASRILQGDVGPGGGQSASGKGVVETDSEVERGLSVGNITTVENGRDLVGYLLLSEGVGLCTDVRRIGESREGRDNAGESGVVGKNDGVVNGTVGVVFWLDGRKGRRGGGLGHVGECDIRRLVW